MHARERPVFAHKATDRVDCSVWHADGTHGRFEMWICRVRAVALAVFLASFFVLAACSMVAAEAKGAFAFRYATSYTKEELDWFARFGVVVSGDILPEDQVQQLRSAGADLFLYAWTTGEYIDDPAKLDPISETQHVLRVTVP